jgi:UDP-N-acetyl-D-mannosaminuronic acid dehydrogenase
LPKSLQGKGIELTSFNNAVRECDIVVMLVDHKAFLKVDRELIKAKIVIDTRGVW